MSIFKRIEHLALMIDQLHAEITEELQENPPEGPHDISNEMRALWKLHDVMNRYMPTDSDRFERSRRQAVAIFNARGAEALHNKKL